MRKFATAFFAAALGLLASFAAAAADLPLDRIKLPPGFAIELWARAENARGLALGKADANGGTVFVGSMQAGKVHAIRYGAGMKVQNVAQVASGLELPLGVAYRDGSLYVSSLTRILRYDNIEQDLAKPPQPVVVTDKLRGERHHGGKYIAFGPDGKLYVPTGAPCNICEPDERHGNLARMNADGSGFEVFARGIRNTVGFDWQPQTKELWFTDNGRDMLGDDAPPDELNHAPRAGMNFGYPYCHGGTIADPEFGAKRKCAEFTAPAQNLGAHVASLGMRFYTGAMFPQQFRGQVFIAEHGSWNRSTKSGYRVTLVKLGADGKAVSYEPFASGWQEGNGQWGRPVDLLVLPDGSLLVSDDYAGAVYRISYRG